ncbi:uncharacterized protein LAESUDRAFT_651799 [Laetiporus sulphureus 93-53]|uniref:Uncharacterized protein n=1 Tax=Laetiporus sulphureus 93-53 TaxID=1314785 RepID=A0A165EM04_9APHY|nr:uncharacterized protein LAESUDRAFT_651799 [Laetiporus sulphureus 93-53]KZT07338.1 hypothetical protein LAESUDRAFT_651799 [Laetiporus sulphureus 93-53]
MFVSAVSAAILAIAALVRADPDPTTPSPGAVYDEGSTCDVAWIADTSGVWKTMNIELMTGNNYQMQLLTTIATVDGTDASKASYSYPCPDVDPNSAIYFYQFTSPDSANVYWTGRFAIATADGSTTPPTESTVYNGETVYWGNGALVGSSGTGTAASSGESSVAPTETATATPTDSTTLSTVVSTPTSISPDSATSSASSTVIASPTSATESASPTSATESASLTSATDSASPTSATDSASSSGLGITEVVQVTSSATTSSATSTGSASTISSDNASNTSASQTPATSSGMSSVSRASTAAPATTSDASSGTSSANGANSSSGSNSTSGALKVHGQVLQASIALGIAAVTFFVAM